MKKFTGNPYFHISYWVFTLIILTAIFGTSWQNSWAAFFFITMLLPIVLGTSYFFNYFLVPHYLLKKQYFNFALYTIYTFIISLYLEFIVLLFSLIYFVHFKFHHLAPNATNIVLLAVVMYLLVFVASFLLMVQQIRENQKTIQKLMIEKEKMKISFLEVISQRKKVKIPYDDIIYIESLSDYIKIHTKTNSIMSKEKISHIEQRLPEIFLRIHRSFIVNKNKIRGTKYNQIEVENTILNIGRSYNKTVKEQLS